ncbi:MAG: hypothetical protein ACOX4Q_05335 [Syntrophomonadales bacterium]|jgi:hypothetical protein
MQTRFLASGATVNQAYRRWGSPYGKDKLVPKSGHTTTVRIGEVVKAERRNPLVKKK